MIQRKYNDLLKENESKFEELFMNDIIDSLLEGNTVVIAGAMTNESMDTRLKEIEIVDRICEKFPKARDYIIFE
jgi:FMN-dependent NADH-azoreductase